MSKNLLEAFDISTGTTGLLYLINKFDESIKGFKGEGKKHPVIILVDNDSGAKAIKNRIKKQLSLEDEIDTSKYYRFVENLYIIFIPTDKSGAIEDLFDQEILDIKIQGKKFDRSNKSNLGKGYGKTIFAESVIKKKQNDIDFSNFKNIFDNIMLIKREHYSMFKI